MWIEYWKGSEAERKVMWCSGNCKGIHISRWKGECGWRMWACCDFQNKMWVGYVYGVQWVAVWQVSSNVERDCLWHLCKASNTVWKWNMVPVRKWDGNFMKNIEICDESNVWSIAQWQKNIYGFDDHVGFEWNHGSVGSGKQCSLVWLCFE